MAVNISEDKWLSAVFGYRVFKIDAVSGSTGSAQGVRVDAREVIREHASRQSRAMYYTKVDTADVEMVRRLCSAGLYVVDVNLTFRMEAPREIRTEEGSGLEICGVRPELSEEVLSIAESCFQYSRFHLDPCIADSIANRVKRQWIWSYLQKERGSELFVAHRGKRPVGFLAALEAESDGRRRAVIDLIGVSRATQQQGVGKALTTHFIRTYKNCSDSLEVGTQVANLPSMRLYEKLGFFIARSQYVMHLHC